MRYVKKLFKAFTTAVNAIEQRAIYCCIATSQFFIAVAVKSTRFPTRIGTGKVFGLRVTLTRTVCSFSENIAANSAML
jgi:hypothetical protein